MSVASVHTRYTNVVLQAFVITPWANQLHQWKVWLEGVRPSVHPGVINWCSSSSYLLGIWIWYLKDIGKLIMFWKTNPSANHDLLIKKVSFKHRYMDSQPHMKTTTPLRKNTYILNSSKLWLVNFSVILTLLALSYTAVIRSGVDFVRKV